jgi:hypothetical protein
MTLLNPDVMYEWEDSRAVQSTEFQSAKVEVIDITTSPVGCSIGMGNTKIRTHLR